MDNAALYTVCLTVLQPLPSSLREKESYLKIKVGLLSYSHIMS